MSTGHGRFLRLISRAHLTTQYAVGFLLLLKSSLECLGHVNIRIAACLSQFRHLALHVFQPGGHLGNLRFEVRDLRRLAAALYACVDTCITKSQGA